MKEYDFGVSWNKDKCFFTRTLISACRQKGLSFLLVDDKNLWAVVKGLESRKIKIKVLLDAEATYDLKAHPYARLCYAVKDAGGIVINDPDRAKFSVDKSVMYYELLNAGIVTPYTVIVRSWEPMTYRLSDGEKDKIRVPFVIKPACGYGELGVVKEAYGTAKEIARARVYNRDDNFLLQERIEPIEFNGRRAWFRVFHVFNRIIPCWWDNRTSWYEHVTGEEFRTYKLIPLVKYASRIAAITRMSWFSTEIAVDKVAGQQRFVTVDYVNDQCAMDTKSETSGGVPEHIVKYTAFSIVHAAARLVKQKRPRFEKRYTVLLGRKGSMGIRGLGYAPDLLVQEK